MKYILTLRCRFGCFAWGSVEKLLHIVNMLCCRAISTCPKSQRRCALNSSFMWCPNPAKHFAATTREHIISLLLNVWVTPALHVCHEELAAIQWNWMTNLNYLDSCAMKSHLKFSLPTLPFSKTTLHACLKLRVQLKWTNVFKGKCNETKLPLAAKLVNQEGIFYGLFVNKVIFRDTACE